MLNRLWWDGRLMFRLLAVLALALVPNAARAYEIPARAAILIEHETGQVLFAKNPDMPLPPASMSKLMTVFMVFERLKDGRLSLDDEFSVSEKAWRKGGSKMFVEVGKKSGSRTFCTGSSSIRATMPASWWPRTWRAPRRPSPRRRPRGHTSSA